MNDILKTQRSFARKGENHKEHRFEDLYHLICREDWLWTALQHVLSNKGARTPGIDGISKEDLKTEEQQTEFVDSLRADLKSGTYKPMPVKRQWIDKPGKDEKRGLGVPTIRDRVVQELLRMLMEPIWESDFLDCSHGFRPGRRTMDCIYFFYQRVQRQSKYYIAIEGDIRKCFDRINHNILLKLVRRRIADPRIVKLVRLQLKAGLMDGALFHDTPEGTPQGGILSPLLANIYLHELDLWWWRKFGSLSHGEKWKRRVNMQGNAILVRYADDFVILWNGTQQNAFALRDELKQFLWDELHLELSEEKTKVTYLTDGIDFLGFHIQLMFPRDNKPWLRVSPTQANLKRFKAKIKSQTKRGTTFATVEMRFKSLNRLIRGWGNYYRHVSFKADARELDFWVNQRVLIWLKNKYQSKGVRWILRRYKVREVTGRYNRWNFGVQDSQSGNMVHIAKLSDTPLTRYIRRKPANPYLVAEVVPDIIETETPLLEERIVNVTPEEVAWREIRRSVLQRDDYRCTECGRGNLPLNAHHKVAKKDGGTDEMDNLITLCEECHYQTPSYGRPPDGKKVLTESRMR
jgi:RNA-directed DNA polymerase